MLIGRRYNYYHATKQRQDVMGSRSESDATNGAATGYPYPSGWRLSRDRLEEYYLKGNVVIREDGKLVRRIYSVDYKGYPIGDIWDDISA